MDLEANNGTYDFSLNLQANQLLLVFEFTIQFTVFSNSTQSSRQSQISFRSGCKFCVKKNPNKNIHK